MHISKKRIQFGKFIWLVILFYGQILSKSNPIDIQIYQNKVSLSAKRAPLDEILFAISNECQLNASIKEGDWPKVSVSFLKQNCSDIYSHLASQFNFQITSQQDRLDVSMGSSSYGYYYPKISSQVVLDRISKSLAQKIGLIEISTGTIAYKKEFSTMAIKALKEADVPVDARRLSYFIFSVDDASYYGFKTMIESIFSEAYRKKGADYVKVVSALVQQFSGKVNQKVSMLAHPSFSVMVPGQSKWSGELSIPHDKNKVLSEFQIQTNIEALTLEQLLFHVKLSTHVPIQSSRSFVEKVDKFESSVVVNIGKMMLLHGFVFNYAQKDSNVSWWTPLFHLLFGGDHVENKMWIGIWVLIE